MICSQLMEVSRMEVEFLYGDDTVGEGTPRRGTSNVFSIPKGAVAVRVLEEEDE